MKNQAKKTAVVLFNLGGPDREAATFPFLYNLFSDPAILSLPFGVRHLVAFMITAKRIREAKHIYRFLGRRSPILPNTYKQAFALEKELGETYKVFVAMRYWHPRVSDVVHEIESYQPDNIVLLPLYPQYSRSTSESSLHEFYRELPASLTSVPTHLVCCYPLQKKLVEAFVAELTPVLEKVEGPYRILFSAHGLPQRMVDKGDPYPLHVYATTESVVNQLTRGAGFSVDHRVTFQSRVGPVEWIKPYTDEEIIQAGRDGVSVVLVPISFVSEHSETLVECDLMYRDLARESGVPSYFRVPTLSDHSLFINAMAELVHAAPSRPKVCGSGYCQGVSCKVQSAVDFDRDVRRAS